MEATGTTGHADATDPASEVGIAEGDPRDPDPTSEVGIAEGDPRDPDPEAGGDT